LEDEQTVSVKAYLKSQVAKFLDNVIS